MIIEYLVRVTHYSGIIDEQMQTPQWTYLNINVNIHLDIELIILQSCPICFYRYFSIICVLILNLFSCLVRMTGRFTFFFNHSKFWHSWSCNLPPTSFLDSSKRFFIFQGSLPLGFSSPSKCVNG